MLTISPDNLLLPPASSALLQIQQLQKDDTYFSSFHHGQRLILLGFFGFFKSNIGQLLVLFSVIHLHRRLLCTVGHVTVLYALSPSSI